MIKKTPWLAVLSFFLLALYIVRVYPPAFSADTYWHLSIGRQVFEEKQIPKYDKYVYGPSDTSFTSTEWLAGLIYFLSVKLLGVNGLVFIRLFLGILTLYFLFLTLKLISNNQLLINGLTLTTGFVLGTRLFDRPELFSYLFLSVLQYLLIKSFIRKKFDKMLYFCPLIFLIWLNIHPYVPFGFLILVFWALIFLINCKKEFSLRLIKPWVIAVVSTIIIIVIQKQQFLIFLNAKNRNIQISDLSPLIDIIPRSANYIFSQTPLDIYIYLLGLSIYATFFFITIKREKFNLVLIIYFFYLVLFLIPFIYYRLLQIAFIISTPSFLMVLSKFHVHKKALYFVQIFLIILLVYSVLINQPFGSRLFRKAIMDSRGNIVEVINDTWHPFFPKDAVVYIKNNLETKRLFTGKAWNPYFMWELPHVSVYESVQFEYLHPEDFQIERELKYGKEGWESLLEKYQIDTVVNSQPGAVLINSTPVYKLVNWRLVYIDDDVQVYAKQEIIKKDAIDISEIDPNIDGNLKFKKENAEKALSQLEGLIKLNPNNAFARVQIIEYLLSSARNLEAKKFAEESRNIIPANPLFSLYLANIHLNLNNCKKAVEFAEEAIEKSKKDVNVNSASKNIINKCK